jgi:hypothetical protein
MRVRTSVVVVGLLSFGLVSCATRADVTPTSKAAVAISAAVTPSPRASARTPVSTTTTKIVSYARLKKTHPALTGEEREPAGLRVKVVRKVYTRPTVDEPEGSWGSSVVEQKKCRVKSEVRVFNATTGAAMDSSVNCVRHGRRT